MRTCGEQCSDPASFPAKPRSQVCSYPSTAQTPTRWPRQVEHAIVHTALCSSMVERSRDMVLGEMYWHGISASPQRA
jgi:hypothetical protein